MMEKGELKLLNDPHIISSLKSVQWQIKENNNQLTGIEIFSSPHSVSHAVEALIRAAWLAKKEKVINLRLHYI